MYNNLFYFIAVGVASFVVGYNVKKYRRPQSDKSLLLIIINKLNQIIMTNAEILAKLEEADTQTNEIAADIADLVANSGVSQEVADRLTAHVEKLKTVASTHTTP